jgi:hypothetical protein
MKPTPRNRGRATYASLVRREIRFLSIVAAALIIGIVTIFTVGGRASAPKLQLARVSKSIELGRLGTLLQPSEQDIGGGTGSAIVTYPTQVPAGYNDPSGIVADPAGDGLWFFSANASDDTLFHYSQATGSLTSWYVASSQSLAPGYLTPMISDGAGNIWLGVNTTLIEKPVGSDTLKVVSLPASPLVTSPVVRLPNPVAGKAESAFEDIDSLATLADGSVVIGRMFSSVLQLYSPDTGQFGAITLPVGMILEGTGSDLVTTPGGAVDVILLGASNGSGAVEEFNGSSWSVINGTCEPESLASGADEIMVVGQGCVMEGPAGSTATSTVLNTLEVSPTELGEVIPGGSPLSGLQTVLATRNGCFLTSGGSAVQLGTVSMTEPIGAPASTATGPSIASITLGLISVANPAEMWFTSGGGGPEIGLVQLS